MAGGELAYSRTNRRKDDSGYGVMTKLLEHIELFYGRGDREKCKGHD